MAEVLHLRRPLMGNDFIHILIAKSRADAYEKAEEIVEHAAADNIAVIGAECFDKGDENADDISYIQMIFPGASYANISWAWLAIAEGFASREFVDDKNSKTGFIIDQIADAINENLI